MGRVLFYENDYPIKVHTSRARSVDRLHMHNVLQLFCVKEGVCIHDIFGNAGKMTPGEISIAPPYNAHRIDGREAEYEMFGMDADCSFFKLSRQFRPWNFFDSCIMPLCDAVSERGHVFRPRKNVADEVFGLYSEIKTLSSARESEKLPAIYGKTIELMTLIATEYSAREGGMGKARTATNCEPMHEVFKYIHKNFRNEISAEEIAKEAMISERSLYRLFEESMNTTLHRYIQALRLEYSKELLRDTDRTVRDIADESGFVYLANFHRYFRSQMGISPSEYRDSFREFK
ncbi:MAG: helix-turn-helix transcriptional regulator [Oscillospiraceae bacterium]|nr:helix-turn-helix transcriptional regulator [Oscillospiraceae bacterium]